MKSVAYWIKLKGQHMELTYQEQNEIFKDKAQKLIPQSTRQITDVKRIAKLEKLLNDMYNHFTNANQDIVSYAEENQDSLLLTSPFEDYLKDIDYRLSTYGMVRDYQGKGNLVPNLVEKLISDIEKDFDYYL